MGAHLSQHHACVSTQAIAAEVHLPEARVADQSLKGGDGGRCLLEPGGQSGGGSGLRERVIGWRTEARG